MADYSPDGVWHTAGRRNRDLLHAGYKADALLQVEEKQSTLGALEDVSSFIQMETPLNAEIEILKSRMVLGKVVRNLKLDLYTRTQIFSENRQRHIPCIQTRRRSGGKAWFNLPEIRLGRRGDQTRIAGSAGLSARHAADTGGRKAGRVSPLLPGKSDLFWKGRWASETEAMLEGVGKGLHLHLAAPSPGPDTQFIVIRRSELRQSARFSSG